MHTARNQEKKIPANGVRASAEREVKANAVAAPPTALAEDRLVSRVEERDGYWVLKEEYRQGINPAEKVSSATEFPFAASSNPLISSL